MALRRLYNAAKKVAGARRTAHSMAKAMNELEEVLDLIDANKEGSPDYVEARAREEYADPSDNELEIDDEPFFSTCDTHTWVSAWVRVEHEEEEEGTSD
jgi:hypothetical protein